MLRSGRGLIVHPDGLIERIESAFSWRSLPARVLDGPLPGDELPDGSEPYGVGPWKEYNLTDFIYREIQGKTWMQVQVPVFVMPIYDLTKQAFCYYLPAFLIYNLRTDNAFDTLDGFLRYPSPIRTTVYSEEYKYGLRDELTMAERQCIADYMVHLKEKCEFYARDIGFWRPGEGGV